jgi:replicative DNA helicase
VRETDAKHILVVIDSLQVWAGSARFYMPQFQTMTEYDLINMALRNAKSIASALACPVVAISHRNRAGQEGGLHASKGSGDVEYQSETVMDLVRDKDSGPNETGEFAVDLIVHKNRHGSVGASRLLFTEHSSSFAKPLLTRTILRGDLYGDSFCQSHPWRHGKIFAQPYDTQAPQVWRSHLM